MNHCEVCGADVEGELVECEVCEQPMCEQCTSNMAYNTCTSCAESENELKEDE